MFETFLLAFSIAVAITVYYRVNPILLLSGPIRSNNDDDLESCCYNRDSLIKFGKYKDTGNTWRTLPIDYLSYLYEHKHFESTYSRYIEAELEYRNTVS
jgi:hypothetical protein